MSIDRPQNGKPARGGNQAVCPGCGRTVSADRPLCPGCGANLPPALPSGTVISKNGASYRVGAVLGQGGFGITYKGVEEATGRSVAIKEYFPARGEHCWVHRDADGVTAVAAPHMEEKFDTGRMSFLKEATVVSKLDDSPESIVKGIDYLEANGTAYLVLDFLPGQPIYKAVRAHVEGKMTPEELFPKLLPLMDGVTWIHKKGIIHRDICPDNIMLLPNGQLCLTDFGSARPVDVIMTGFFKPGYAPVEQVTTVLGSPGFYSDVYTLAASAVYCLTGRDPESSTERVAATKSGSPDPLVLPDCLTPEQKAVFRKAMAIEPADRYRSMEEFKRALIAAAPWLEPSKPGPVPGPNSLRDFVETHFRAVLAALAAAVLVLIVIVIVLAVSGSGSRKVLPPEAGQSPGTEYNIVIDTSACPGPLTAAPQGR